MNDKKLYIPQSALEKTKQVCAKELRCVIEKQSKSKRELFFRFLRIDFAFYFKWTLFAFAILMFVVVLFPEFYALSYCGYWFCFGMMSVYQLYKNEHYQSEELFYPVYLNKGRILLFQSASIALLELFLFCLMLVVSMFVPKCSIIVLILGTFLPLFLAQIISLQLLRYIHTLRSAMVWYMVIFGGYIGVYRVFETNILAYVNGYHLMGCMLVLLIAVLISFFYLYKTNKQEGLPYGIDVRTY